MSLLKKQLSYTGYSFTKYFQFNLLRTAGWFIDQRREGQERIISITITYKWVTLMQMWVKSTPWLLLKRETIPTFNKQERRYWHFLVSTYICSQKGVILKRLKEGRTELYNFCIINYDWDAILQWGIQNILLETQIDS